MKEKPPENIYSLLSKDLQEIIAATNGIKDALKHASNKIAEIKKKYPDSGIGDTDTDEEIASDFYNMVHHYDIKDSTDQQNPEKASE